MRDLLQVDICLSKKFDENHQRFRDTFFTTPKRSLIFDDEEFNAFGKKYSFDIAKFAQAIDERDPLVQDFILDLKQELSLQDKTDEELAQYIASINPEHEDYPILQRMIDGYIYKKEEGVELLLAYQTYLQENEPKPFNDFLKDQITTDPKSFERKYPNTNSSILDKLPQGKSIEDMVVVGNIFHNPERLSIGDEEYVLTVDEQKKARITFSTSLVEEDHDYDIGAFETRAELFERGDFSGCTLSNIEFFGRNLDHISFRDCVLKKIGFNSTSMQNADLRGAKLTDTTFSGYGGREREEERDCFLGMKLNFSDCAFVQKLGILQIRDRDKGLDIEHEAQLAAIENEFTNNVWRPYRKQLEDLDNQLKSLIPTSSSNTSFLGQIFTAVSNIQHVMRRAKSIEELERDFHTSIQEAKTLAKTTEDVELKDTIQGIIDTYKASRRKYFLANREKQHKINELLRFDLKDSDIELDPTYATDSFKQSQDGIKRIVMCKKADLEDYKRNKNDKESFVDYYKRIHVSEISPGEIIVPNFSQQDLSNMDLSDLDLSGIIMSKAILRGVNFSKSSLVGSSLEGAIIDHANFAGAHVTDLNMIGVKGECVNFENIEGARLRLAGCQLGSTDKAKRANFKGAKLYALDATLSDLENCSMEEANVERADFTNANMLYIDAQKAKMREANLFNATIAEGNFTEADLRGATLNKLKADHANFTEAQMEKVEAINAQFRNAVLSKVKASGGNFTKTDFDKVVADHAKFQNSIMDEITARGANFESAILRDVKARQADFREAVLSKVKAERIDIREAVLSHATCHSIKLKNAIMEKVKADNADFTKADMESVKARFAQFQSAIFEEAKLRAADIRNTNLVNADLRKADVTEVIFQDEDGKNSALIINADLRNAIGAEKLRELQKNQEELHKGIFGGYSRYGRCNAEEAARRYQCQKLGAMILGAAAGGAYGYTIAGPLTSAGGSAVAAFCNSQFLDLYKENFHKEYGYINSGFGDRLAELGAIAAMMGADGTEQTINGALLGTIMTSYNLVQGSAHTLIGVAGVALGGKVLYDGVQEKSLGKKIIGGALTALSTLTTAIGLAQASSSINTIIMSAAAGGLIGSAMGAKTAVSELYDFKEQDGETVSGKKPEEVYDIASEKLSKQWKRIMPTWQKICTAAICGAAAAVAAVYIIVPLLNIMAAGTIIKASVVTTTGLASALSAFLAAYLFEEKITTPVKDFIQTVSRNFDQEPKEKTLVQQKEIEGMKPLTLNQTIPQEALTLSVQLKEEIQHEQSAEEHDIPLDKQSKFQDIIAAQKASGATTTHILGYRGK